LGVNTDLQQKPVKVVNAKKAEVLTLEKQDTSLDGTTLNSARANTTHNSKKGTTGEAQQSNHGLDESFLIYLGEIQEIKDELVDPIALTEGLAKNKKIVDTQSAILASEHVINKHSEIESKNNSENKANKEIQRDINYEN
jgi:hypothetical protein